jgi:hypothetical protein
MNDSYRWHTRIGQIRSSSQMFVKVWGTVENQPSCVHSACGKSRSHPTGAGCRRSYSTRENIIRSVICCRNWECGGRDRRGFGRDVLLRIESQERQVEEDRKPVAIDNEEEGQESVNSGLGDDVGVQAVAEVDGVDVVTA